MREYLFRGKRVDNGEWDSDLAEITFDSIVGSYLPYADHDTIDFVYRGNTVLRLALKGGRNNAV